MGKHDKIVAASSDEFRDNSIRDLRDRLAFAEETIKKLQEQYNTKCIVDVTFLSPLLS